MPTYSLLRHVDHSPRAVTAVEVEVSGDHQALLLSYRVRGHERMVVPDRAAPARTDGLWQSTCFELFLLIGDGRYAEFNFSPSTQWAAYAFDGCRQGMTPLPRGAEPLVERLNDGVVVRCDLGGLPDGQLLIGLSAVIEEEGGVKSYWALAHPPGAPDFHHPACFTARLPAPERP